MRYKPLLLALLIGFASPSFAAKDAPKEKAAPVKKSVKAKRDDEPLTQIGRASCRERV